jgi:hypothetical protein
MGKMSC